MILYLYTMLGINILIPAVLFLTMKKKRKLFTDRYGMTISFSASLIFSLSLGTALFFTLPVSFSVLIFISAAAGSIIGLSYGILITFQSLIIGLFNGTIGSLMGTMLAAVIIDPSLCGLPSQFSTLLDRNIILITLFLTLLSLLSSLLLRFSYRV
ncbi:hypothetical protein ELQ35_10355 [Peribacillus cavernae]|uniref:Uncharacterized protein n=1 Tax=Peribacillus cavernae TaxID=1674310 RepID=A0A433HLT7_9BACI|nr:hypothetical protein [Peribacillus cavernae]MDQ0218931.1 hypothetical protein [Peribacillus cavernae]RUQ29356.1 hypothetical protein ELQ35_10355 [Peribacillus cavernae]